MPTYSTHGTIDTQWTYLPLTPSYPTPISSGEVMYLQVAHGSNATVAAGTVTGATEFTLINTTTGVGGQLRQFIYRRLGTSTEAGNVTLNISASSSTIRWRAVIHKFIGMSTLFEDSTATVTAAASTDCAAPTVTAEGSNRLGVAFGTWALGSDVISIPDFAGETGANWLKAFDAFDAGSTLAPPLMFMQTAQFASSGVVTGGISTSTTSGAYVTAGLSLIGGGGAPVFLGGIFNTAIFGGGIVTE